MNSPRCQPPRRGGFHHPANELHALAVPRRHQVHVVLKDVARVKLNIELVRGIRKPLRDRVNLFRIESNRRIDQRITNVRAKLSS
jgi:hypothetical protein